MEISLAVVESAGLEGGLEVVSLEVERIAIDEILVLHFHIEMLALHDQPILIEFALVSPELLGGHPHQQLVLLRDVGERAAGLAAQESARLFARAPLDVLRDALQDSRAMLAALDAGHQGLLRLKRLPQSFDLGVVLDLLTFLNKILILFYGQWLKAIRLKYLAFNF